MKAFEVMCALLPANHFDSISYMLDEATKAVGVAFAAMPAMVQAAHAVVKDALDRLNELIQAQVRR